MKNQFVKRLISLSLCAVMIMTVGKDVNASVRNSQVQKVDEIILDEANAEDVQGVKEVVIDEVSYETSEEETEETQSDSDMEAITKEEYSAVSAVTIQTVKGYEEGAYVKWTPVSDADGYVVYCSSNSSSFAAPIDDTLIRDYGSYMRADIVGLSKGDYYFKVDAVKVDSATGDQTVIASTITSKATVTTYDRSGFAFIDSSGKPYMNGTVGAYNADGTLKSGAVVIYLTEWNKNDVKVKIKNGSTSYKDCVGILDILTTIASGKDNRPIDIRVVGCLTDPKNIDSNSNFSGDLAIANNTNGQPITLEGIGDDATFNGFGIVLKKCSNVEVRNMAVINCNSKEGDNFSINGSVNNVWMHNNDSFYGEPGGDSDQKKGDGAMDCKRADYVTLSYNHFFDNGKCNLLSVSSEDAGNHITYHHNWYDHSDSRHPRARYYNVHTYNNYFDHNASYGMGATLGASIFAENNYFDSVARPFIVASQGHDLEKGDKTDSSSVTSTLSKESAGFIKEYGNVFVNSGSKYTPYDPVSCPYDFDAYKATSRDEVIPSTIKVNHIQDESSNYTFYAGYGTTSVRTYSNFDTASTFYSYTVDAANDVPAIVKANAGRVDGGDFKYTLGLEAKDSGIVQDLKDRLLAYETSLVKIGGIQKTSEITYYTVVFDFNGGENTSHATSTSVKVESGKTVTSLANLPSKTGYTFVRWNDEDGVPFDFSQGINRNITLTAEWKENINIDDTDTSLKLDMADVPKETYSESFTKHGFTIAATQNKTVTVAASSKTVDGVGYTQRLQFGGSGDIGEGYRTIKFTITKKSKLVVVAESASSSLSTDRPLQVSDKNNTYTLKTFTSGDYAAGKFTQELEPGTWYVYSGNGGINVYYIGVEEITGGGTDPDPDPSTDIDYPATKNADGSNTIDLTEGLFAGKTYGSKDVVFSVKEDMAYSEEKLSIGGINYLGRVQGTTNPVIDNNIAVSGAVLVIDTNTIKSGNVKISIKSPFSKNNKTIYIIKSLPSYTQLEKKEFTTTDNYQFSVDLEPNCQYMFFGSGTKVCIADITYTYEKDTTLEPEPDPEPTKYTVTFNTNGGEGTFAPQTVEEGSKATNPATGTNVPTKEGYTFKYWSLTNTDGAAEYNFDTAVTENIILYAIYEENKGSGEPDPEPEKYTVTFDSQGGSAVGSISDVESGKTITKPGDPTKEGYTFGGWYKEAGCTNAWNFTTDKVTNNVTLYAKWTENKPDPDPEPTKYTVTFNTNGGEGTFVSQTVEEGQKATNPVTETNIPTKEGYTFKYWSLTNTDGAAEYNFDTAVKGNITLYAIYEENKGSGDPEPDPEPGIDKNAPFIAVFEDTNSDEYETIYDGSKKEPKVTVTDASGEKLIINSDYTVKYVNNVKATEGSLKKATVTITGKGLYSGNKTLTFDILRKNISDSDIVEGYIEAKPSQPVKPLLAYNGIILKASDYTLHANVKKVPADVPANSTFTYVITGTGNFVGTREMELSVVSEITAKKLVAVQKATKFEYNTNSLFEDIDNSVVVYSATDKDKTAPLENNKDYVVSYSKVLEEENETPVGKYSVVITGRGEYTGQILKTVNVVPAKNEEITVDDIEEKEYSPQGVTVPSDEIIVRDTTNDSVLTQGVDYKVTYANNKAVSTNEKKAKLNITFIGNYQGHKAVSKEFAITKAQINDVKVYATDMIYKGAGIYKSPVYVELNNVIVPVSEYSVNYYLYYDKNNSEENVAMNPQNKLALVDDKTGEDVEEKEVTAVISIKDKNIEAGDISTIFTVKKADLDLSKLKVTVYDKTIYNSKTRTYKSVTGVEYTGKEICLDDMPDYSKINDETETSRYYVDYQIQKKNLATGKNEWIKVDQSDLKIENVNNVRTGSMTAIISSDSGEYAGAKVLKIKIVPKQMKTFVKNNN